MLQDLLGMPRDAALTRCAEVFAEFEAKLRRHIYVEEHYVFPQFEESTGMRHVGPTVLLRREHQEVGERLAQFSSALDLGTGIPELRPQLLALRALLHDHSRREEAVLYSTCDRMLEPGECDAARRELQAPLDNPGSVVREAGTG